MQYKIYLLLAILTLTVTAQTCHHSCATCLDQHYTHCLTCADPVNKLITTRSPMGLCSAPAVTAVNGVGLGFIIVVIGVGLFLKSQHIFYFIFSLQTLGLLSLM